MLVKGRVKHDHTCYVIQVGSEFNEYVSAFEGREVVVALIRIPIELGSYG